VSGRWAEELDRMVAVIIPGHRTSVVTPVAIDPLVQSRREGTG